MTKDKALKLINQTTSKPNLIKHMLAVAVCMKAIAKELGENEEIWEITGIVHDADFEKVGEKHPSDLVVKYLTDLKADPAIIQAVKAHGWQITPGCPKPVGKMDWALYCCDHLTGLIIAVTLVRPTKKIADVDLDAVLKKWKNKDFAKGTRRENIALCEEKLGIKLPDFIQICLKAMQGINQDLGL
jgi:predicted hydrolase (HD superfamily)